MRTELLDFNGADDSLVASLRHKLAQLEAINAPHDDMDVAGPTRPTGHRWQVDKAHELNVEIETLLEQLRSSSGQDSLLRPLTAGEMRALLPRGCRGAIVVINALFRCDAILVHDGIT